MNPVSSISAVKTDSAYRRDYSRFAVYLNGKIVVDCVRASSKAGFAARLVRDHDGNFRPNEYGNGPQYVTERGRVRIQATSLPLTERYSQAFLQLFLRNPILPR